MSLPQLPALATIVNIVDADGRTALYLKVDIQEKVGAPAVSKYLYKFGQYSSLIILPSDGIIELTTSIQPFYNTIYLVAENSAGQTPYPEQRVPTYGVFLPNVTPGNSSIGVTYSTSQNGDSIVKDYAINVESSGWQLMNKTSPFTVTGLADGAYTVILAAAETTNAVSNIFAYTYSQRRNFFGNVVVSPTTGTLGAPPFYPSLTSIVKMVGSDNQTPVNLRVQIKEHVGAPFVQKYLYKFSPSASLIELPSDGVIDLVNSAQTFSNIVYLVAENTKGQTALPSQLLPLQGVTSPTVTPLSNTFQVTFGNASSDSDSNRTDFAVRVDGYDWRLANSSSPWTVFPSVFNGYHHVTLAAANTANAAINMFGFTYSPQVDVFTGLRIGTAPADVPNPTITAILTKDSNGNNSSISVDLQPVNSNYQYSFDGLTWTDLSNTTPITNLVEFLDNQIYLRHFNRTTGYKFSHFYTFPFKAPVISNAIQTGKALVTAGFTSASDQQRSFFAGRLNGGSWSNIGTTSPYTFTGVNEGISEVDIASANIYQVDALSSTGNSYFVTYSPSTGKRSVNVEAVTTPPPTPPPPTPPPPTPPPPTPPPPKPPVKKPPTKKPPTKKPPVKKPPGKKPPVKKPPGKKKKLPNPTKLLLRNKMSSILKLKY